MGFLVAVKTLSYLEIQPNEQEGHKELRNDFAFYSKYVVFTHHNIKFKYSPALTDSLFTTVTAHLTIIHKISVCLAASLM